MSDTLDAPAQLALPAEQTATERRLHPLTLLLNLSRQVPQMIIGLVALRLSGPEELRPWVALMALLAILGMFGFEFYRWWRFSYRLEPDELRIASGVFSRNVRSIPYERIQDVNLEQGVFARVLGLAKVRLETGSSGSGDEGALDSVDLAEAERLRDVIRLRKAQNTAEPDQPGAGPAEVAADRIDAPLLFAMDPRRILIAGVFNFSLVFFALVGALLNNIDFLIPGDFWDPRRLLDFLGLDDLFAALDMAARIASVIAALFGVLVIGLIGGIIRTFLREYGFRLERTETGFRRRRGLLTLTDVVMPLHRIQAAVIATGPIRRRFGWYELKVQSLASDSDKESDHSIAPFATEAELRHVLAETRIGWNTDYPAMRRVDPAMWWVPLVFALPVPIIGLGIAATLASPWIALAYAALPLVPLASWLHWRAHRYALVDDQLYVRHGFWNQTLILLPVRRVQSVDIRQSFVSRYIGLAEIAIGVAGRSGAVTIQAIPLGEATKLRSMLLGNQPGAWS
ncbi:putative membrane protein [Blastomonas natatoria]|uniref:Putative membrane protein n=1 Tax=Blastomonas natatoria TaxID=34015 RepID=A0A2V3V918_9SPHN|nr:PH domain-containing protein [Blastomonas natatoria]PXW77654.1 putative membrane protein [Blastomonas natatoria]